MIAPGLLPRRPVAKQRDASCHAAGSRPTGRLAGIRADESPELAFPAARGGQWLCHSGGILLGHAVDMLEKRPLTLPLRGQRWLASRLTRPVAEKGDFLAQGRSTNCPPF